MSYHYHDLDDKPMLVIDYKREYERLLQEREVLLRAIEELTQEHYDNRECINKPAK